MSHKALQRQRKLVRQRGSAMIEFVVVGPLITLIGTMVLQYVLMFNAKNLVNHASFMAARAGSMGNASLSSTIGAYTQALIPLYGGGLNAQELLAAKAKAATDLAGHLRVEILNPTKESFDDFADPALQAKFNTTKRVIPNSSQTERDPGGTNIGSTSGQNIQDANLLKLKITHGYELKVPLAGSLMVFLMKWNDNNRDAFATSLYAAGRVPLVTDITVHMQSDAIEPDNPVSTPGQGNNGNPQDPGNPVDPVKKPPQCVTVGCTVIVDPNAPEGSGDPSYYSCPPGSIDCKQICKGST